ncbi:hypothetical protein [Kineosporia succinea]|uniref:Flagellar hook-basal body complex protein FliE n=1 Tax=Kineosporia succinea TaxID=84632 RepID=A0ABT9NWP0_9ACTN|nr:hypothetical protein [Kineosporia succinea]MDP9824846.1 flagellar hook-basal body complex protein FliE [Kineosporia succinea]
MRSRQTVAVRSLVVLPLAALLLAGCGDSADSAAEQINQLNDTANQLNDTAQQLEDATENLDLGEAEKQLQDAAGNLGEAGQAKLACSTVKAVVGTSEGGDTEAAVTQLAATVSTIFTTIGEDEGSSFDLDTVMKEECPAVHADALELVERDSLNELYSN